MMQIALHLVGLGVIVATTLGLFVVWFAKKNLSKDDPLRVSEGTRSLILFFAMFVHFGIKYFVFDSSRGFRGFAVFCPILIGIGLCAPIGTKLRNILAIGFASILGLLIWQLVNIEHLSGNTLVLGYKRQPSSSEATAILANARAKLKVLKDDRKMNLDPGWLDRDPNLSRLNQEQRDFLNTQPKSIILDQSRWFTRYTGIKERATREVGIFTEGGNLSRSLLLSEIRVRK